MASSTSAGERRDSKSGQDSAGSRRSRLSAQDWIHAAFDIMIDSGISGVTIQRLCDALGVTKGSFYHHFSDLDDFHRALAKSWADEGVLVLDDVQRASDAGAGLRRAVDMFSDRRTRRLTRAARDWAHHNADAKAAIKAADAAQFGRVKAAFIQLGFDDIEADTRAKILFYMGVGFSQVGALGTRKTAERQTAVTWDLLTA